MKKIFYFISNANAWSAVSKKLVNKRDTGQKAFHFHFENYSHLQPLRTHDSDLLNPRLLFKK